MTMQDTIAIASMGLDAQSDRLMVHTANIANIHTPNYVRQLPVLVENSYMPFDQVLQNVRSYGATQGFSGSVPDGVQMQGTVSDTTPGKKLYMPDHPDADSEGYITMSNTNVLGDMSDAMMASKMYEANMAMITITKAMANKAIELGRQR